MLQFFPHSEGRVKTTNGGTTWLYEFDLKDHLGNVRATVCDLNSNGLFEPASELIQADDFYPYGARIPRLKPTNDNKYTYNGKELVEDFGLNWYHYGARYYDPQLGRWWSVDRADEFFSAYIYVSNNPINKYDPDGNFEVSDHMKLTFDSHVKKYGLLGYVSGFVSSVQHPIIDWVFSLFSNAHNDGITDGEFLFNSFNGENCYSNTDHTIQDFYAHSNYVELTASYYLKQGFSKDELSSAKLPNIDKVDPNSDFASYLKTNLRTTNFNIDWSQLLPSNWGSGWWDRMFGGDANDANDHYKGDVLRAKDLPVNGDSGSPYHDKALEMAGQTTTNKRENGK